ncbi:hypothetical protein GCM10027073_06370 [Streptomyces chlorus]
MTTATTKTTKVASTLCQVKIVSVSGMIPSPSRPSAMISCTASGLEAGLATCSATEPDSPWAHTVPSPRNAMAPSAR